MSKYRQHISQLVKNSQIDFEKLAKKELAQVWNFCNCYCCCWLFRLQKTVEQADKINEMTAVMQHALKLDEEDSNKDKELFAQLITENKVLK